MSWSTANARARSTAGIVSEENYFFKLSRYQKQLGERLVAAINSGFCRKSAKMKPRLYPPGLGRFFPFPGRPRDWVIGYSVPGDPSQVCTSGLTL